MHVLHRIVFAAAVTTAMVVPGAAWGAERVVNVALEDQFRNRHETLRYRGDVVVLVYAGRHGAEAAIETGRRLHCHFHPSAAAASASEWSRQPVVGPAGWPAAIAPPDVHVIPVACLPEVPKSLHAVVRSRFRKESPQLQVWLDFDDLMGQKFGISPDEPNVLLLDTAGCQQGTLSGHLDERRFAEVVQAVDGLRQASLQERSAMIPVGATTVVR